MTTTVHTSHGSRNRRPDDEKSGKLRDLLHFKRRPTHREPPVTSEVEDLADDHYFYDQLEKNKPTTESSAEVEPIHDDRPNVNRDVVFLQSPEKDKDRKGKQRDPFVNTRPDESDVAFGTDDDTDDSTSITEDSDDIDDDENDDDDDDENANLEEYDIFDVYDDYGEMELPDQDVEMQDTIEEKTKEANVHAPRIMVISPPPIIKPPSTPAPTPIPKPSYSPAPRHAVFDRRKLHQRNTTTQKPAPQPTPQPTPQSTPQPKCKQEKPSQSAPNPNPNPSLNRNPNPSPNATPIPNPNPNPKHTQVMTNSHGFKQSTTVVEHKPKPARSHQFERIMVTKQLTGPEELHAEIDKIFEKKDRNYDKFGHGKSHWELRIVPDRKTHEEYAD